MTDYLVRSCDFERLADICSDFSYKLVLFAEFFVVVFLYVFRHIVKQYAVCVVTCIVRHCLPDFLCGEAQNGREQPYKGVENDVHCSLRTPPLHTVGRLGVESVLDDIKVEITHIQHAELVDCNLHKVEIVGVIPVYNLFNKSVEFVERKAVYLCHIFVFNLVGFGGEIAEVAEHIAGGVSDFAVAFGKLL